jgi:drug/metabolite transporter (DMT)-like permease
LSSRLDGSTAALTLAALVAFAANSILTRMALGADQLDAASFTTLRLCSGALVLALLAARHLRHAAAWRGRSLVGPVALFVYAAPFSFAYLRIGAAVGALVLFGVVQLTMISWGLRRGEQPDGRTWAGFILAAGGLAALTVPSVTRPDLTGVALMAVAGIAWGVYSIVGTGGTDPLTSTARNFILAVPLALLLSGTQLGKAHGTATGVTLAVISGAVTSGLGYAIWYRALRRLAVTQAGMVQLSVPVIAALGAVVFLGESLSTRLLLSGVAVLGGIALVLSARPR